MAAHLGVAAIDHHLTRSGGDLDLVADQIRGNRIAGGAEADRREAVDLARLAPPERRSEARERSHHVAFLGQSLDRDRGDLAVRPGVDLRTPPLRI